MARPRDPGLIYFNLDVDFFSDQKIRILLLRYGADGIAIYLFLLCQIYRKGYFIHWNDDAAFILANDLNMKVDKVQQVLTFLLERSMFDKQLFQSDAVLTSTGIQERYQEGVKGKAQKNPIEIDSHWILPPERTQPWLKVTRYTGYSENNGDNSENNGEDSENNSTNQIKSNQMKSKHTKECELDELFHEFWKLYPKKVGKAKALKAWKKISPSLELTAEMTNALTVQMKSEQWTRDSGQFIPYPATWLNQERWTDDLSEYRKPSGKTKQYRTSRDDNVGNFPQREYSSEFLDGFYEDIMAESEVQHDTG